MSIGSKERLREPRTDFMRSTPDPPRSLEGSRAVMCVNGAARCPVPLAAVFLNREWSHGQPFFGRTKSAVKSGRSAATAPETN